MPSTAPFTFFAFLLTLLLVRTASIEIEVNPRILPIPNNITLSCRGFDNDMVNDIFRIKREVDGQTTIFTDYITSLTYEKEAPVKTASFLLTPDREGYYSCEVGQVTSSNSVALVAYPEPDKDIMAITTYFATFPNDSPPIRCEFQRGTLAATFYTMQWWKGSEMLVTWTDGAQTDSKYQVLDDFSLVVRDITAMDTSDAYYCTVSVHYASNKAYTNFGINYELVVTGNLMVINGLSDEVRKVNNTHTLSCAATGIPQMDSTWLFNGIPWDQLPPSQSHRYSITKQLEELTSGVYSQSTNLSISKVQNADTGHVQCLFYNSKEPGMQFASSTSSLIVLGAPSLPQVVASGSSVYLSVILSGVIPTTFSLSIRYLHSNTDNTVRTITVTDPSFNNTDTIENFLIPAKDLPPFNSFITSVAVQVNGVTGPYSQYSGIISYTFEDVTSCATSPPTASQTAAGDVCVSLSTMLAVVFVLIFIMAMVVLLLTIFFVFYTKYRNKQQIRDNIQNKSFCNRGQRESDVDLDYSTQQSAGSPLHISMAQTTFDSSPKSYGRRQLAKTNLQGLGVGTQPPLERQTSPSSQYETIGAGFPNPVRLPSTVGLPSPIGLPSPVGLPSPAGLPLYHFVTSSNQQRKLSNLDMPAPLPAVPEVPPSSSEPVLTGFNTEPRGGITIARKESPRMVDTGTSASPPAAFSMPDLSSTKTDHVVKEMSDNSPSVLQKLKGTADTKDHEKASPQLNASQSVPIPPIICSFKAATRSGENSPANVKRRKSQEDGEKSKDFDEIEKENLDEIMKEYEILGTPPKETSIKL